MGVSTTQLIDAGRACKRKAGQDGNLYRKVGDMNTITHAYLKIKSNRGTLTRGVELETIEGINLKYQEKISKEIVSATYIFTPNRVVEIPKPASFGKHELRPLGIRDGDHRSPSSMMMVNPRQKIVQAAIEMTICAIFEEDFLDCRQCFSPARSTHTALKFLHLGIANASAHTWVIAGDIKGCIDNIPHWLILNGLRRRIDCPVTRSIVHKLLSAGYVVDTSSKSKHKQPSVTRKTVGVPQGLVTTPLLCNIPLHELDQYVMKVLRTEFQKGKSRKKTPAVTRLRYPITRTMYVKYVLKA